MRILLALLVCAGLAGCGWTKKAGRGTNFEPDDKGSVNEYPSRRL